jgi:hypothetical protein
MYYLILAYDTTHAQGGNMWKGKDKVTVVKKEKDGSTCKHNCKDLL